MLSLLAITAKITEWADSFAIIAQNIVKNEKHTHLSNYIKLCLVIIHINESRDMQRAKSKLKLMLFKNIYVYMCIHICYKVGYQKHRKKSVSCSSAIP